MKIDISILERGTSFEIEDEVWQGMSETERSILCHDHMVDILEWDWEAFDDES